MAKKGTEPANSETVKQNDSPPDNAIKDRKTIVTAKRLETVVAILLGITTLLSAWATWIGSLHHGVQSINFTKSNNVASQGTAEYNAGMQTFLADYMAWNTLSDYYYDLEEAKLDGDQAKTDLIKDKIATFKEQNITDILAEGIKWMEENNEANPFNMPGIFNRYFESGIQTMELSNKLLNDGMKDNTKGDSYNLVCVIFSMTLFLLGIVGTFKNMPNRITVLGIAVVFLIVGVIYMCTIPMPTNFDKMNFFEFG